MLSAEAYHTAMKVCLSFQSVVSFISLFMICETLFHPLDSAVLFVASIKTEDEK
jgi:hypothetical protein